MKKIIIFSIIAMVAGAACASTSSDYTLRVKQYLYNAGIYTMQGVVLQANNASDTPVIAIWNIPLPRPTAATLPTLQASKDVEALLDAVKQNNKPAGLKLAENNFMAFCQQVFGSPGKRSVAEFTAAAQQMADPNQAIVMVLQAQGLIREVEVATGAWSGRWYDPNAAWYYITTHE